jgi:hypothetical protein
MTTTMGRAIARSTIAAVVGAVRVHSDGKLGVACSNAQDPLTCNKIIITSFRLQRGSRPRGADSRCFQATRIQCRVRPQNSHPMPRSTAVGYVEACGLDQASAQARPRTSGSQLAPHHVHEDTAGAGCTPRLQWGPVVASCSTAVRTPGSSHDQQPTDPPRHPPQMHTYVQTVQSSTWLSPGPIQPPQSFNYELHRPGCGDTRPLRREGM